MKKVIPQDKHQTRGMQGILPPLFPFWFQLQNKGRATDVIYLDFYVLDMVTQSELEMESVGGLFSG